MINKKVIVVVKGGIGNQLFCFAAAKRLAINSNANLIIDDKSGFERDFYKRKYLLNHFKINEVFADNNERLEPLKRFRRKFLKLINNCITLNKRNYIWQISNDFDRRILDYKVRKKVFLDGYWQSELYFKDIEKIIRRDLEIIPPIDKVNLDTAHKILKTTAVCIHVRWFNPPAKNDNSHVNNNIDKEYYLKAISLLYERIENPYFYIFSDFPEETTIWLGLSKDNSLVIKHNMGDENAYADLWLMSLCKHFIIANSTFSWWGAWLANNPQKIVIAPNEEKNVVNAWGFDDLIPKEWIVV